jgi:hypothetical protein
MNNDFRTYATRLDTDVFFSATRGEHRLFLKTTSAMTSVSALECATFMSPEKAKEVLKLISSIVRGDEWKPTMVDQRSRVVTETYNEFTVVDLPPDEYKCKCDLDMGELVDDMLVDIHENDWLVIEDAQLSEILTDRICAMRGTSWCKVEVFQDILHAIRGGIACHQRYGLAVAGNTVLFDTLIQEFIKDCVFFTKYKVNLTGIDCTERKNDILVVYTT